MKPENIKEIDQRITGEITERKPSVKEKQSVMDSNENIELTSSKVAEKLAPEIIEDIVIKIAPRIIEDLVKIEIRKINERN